jgi:hypothetical protein
MKPQIGSKFGNIEIIGYAEKYKRYIQWSCKCSCGKILIIQNRYLKTTINCGQCNKIRIDKTIFTGVDTIKKILKNDTQSKTKRE